MVRWTDQVSIHPGRPQNKLDLLLVATIWKECKPDPARGINHLSQTTPASDRMLLRRVFYPLFWLCSVFRTLWIYRTVSIAHQCNHSHKSIGLCSGCLPKSDLSPSRLNPDHSIVVWTVTNHTKSHFFCQDWNHRWEVVTIPFARMHLSLNSSKHANGFWLSVTSKPIYAEQNPMSRSGVIHWRCRAVSLKKIRFWEGIWFESHLPTV